MRLDGQQMQPGNLVRFMHPYYISEVDGVIAVPKHSVSDESIWATGLFLKNNKDGTARVLYKGSVVRIMYSSIDKKVIS